MSNKYNWAKDPEQINLLSKAIEKFRHENKPVKLIATSLSWPITKVEAGIRYLKRRGEKINLSQTTQEESSLETIATNAAKLKILSQKAQKISTIKDLTVATAIAEMIIEKIPTIDFRPPMPFILSKHQNKIEDAVLVVSDAQAGCLVKKSDVGNLGEYNKDIIPKRGNHLLERTISLLERHGPVKRLWVWTLGDMIEGHDVFKGQPFYLDMNAIDSVIFMAEYMAKFEIQLLDYVDEIVTVEIPGNHGFIGGSKANAPVTCNFDRIYYKLKAAINQNYKKITRVIPDTWFQLVSVQNHSFLLVHGDGIPSYLSLPYYGIDRAAANYMSLLREQIYCLVLGHFHVSASIPMGYGKKLINGCWVGPTDLSKRSRTSIWPSQWLFGVHPEHGVSFRYEIDLITPKERDEYRASIFDIDKYKEENGNGKEKNG